MKRIVLFIVMILFASASLAIASPTPAGANMDRFPVMSGPLTNDQMADMGLTPMRLAEDKDFLQYNRSRKVFELSRLFAGEIVLVDREKEIRYRAFCGNRLEVIAAPKTCPPVAKPCVPCAPVCPPVVPAPAGLTFWQWLGRAAAILGLGLLALLLLAALVAAILAAIAGAFYRRHPYWVAPPAPWRGVGPGWCRRRGMHRYGTWCHGCGQMTY